MPSKEAADAKQVTPLSQKGRPSCSLQLGDADLGLGNANWTKGLQAMSDWIWSGNLNPAAFPICMTNLGSGTTTGGESYRVRGDRGGDDPPGSARRLVSLEAPAYCTRGARTPAARGRMRLTLHREPVLRRCVVDRECGYG